MNVDLWSSGEDRCSFYCTAVGTVTKGPRVEICLVGERKTKQVLQDTSEENCCRKRKKGGF